MLRRKRQDRTVRLPCQCSLKDGGRTGACAADLGFVTDRCRVPCRSLEEAADYISDGIGETWAAISCAIDGRRHELDTVLEQLVAVAAPGCDDGASRPIRTLLVSASAEARKELRDRVADDGRFFFVGEAATPGEVVALCAGDLPDLVVVHLARLDPESLGRLAELQHWSPRTALVIVYGIDASGVADLVVTSRLADGWSFAQFTSSSARAGGSSGGGAPPAEVGSARTGVVPPRRSIIHEAMRQIGVPMGRKQ